MVHSKERKKFCICGNLLWIWIDDDRVKIFGANGQDYEVGFNYIDVTCKECGKRICVQSDVADTISDLFERTDRTIKRVVFASEQRPYTLLSAFDKKKVKENLSAKQKEILDILANGEGKIKPDEISREIGLPKKIVVRNIEIIKGEIEKIKPNFGKRVTRVLRK